MQRAQTIPEIRAAVKDLKAAGKRVAFVPTMGSLHAGHLSLVEKARESADAVVVSVYVNPTQFGPDEDFDEYPRQLEADAKLCEEAGVAVLYTPRDDSMYPPGFSTFVQEELLSAPLCGRGRAGHFRGVCTVVTKLLNQVGPDLAIFGQKDAQQARVIQQIVRDLDLPVEVLLAPISRDPDGLARSSRNQYLDASQRESALTLRQALAAIEASFAKGERSTDALLSIGKGILKKAEGVQLEYLEILEAKLLQPLHRVDRVALVAVAAEVGPARLIDNTVLDGVSGEIRATL